MGRLLLLLTLLAVPSVADAVDIMVRAKDPVHDFSGYPAAWVEKNISQKGDILWVEDTGFVWGTKQFKPLSEGGQYCILRITDKTKAQAREYVVSHYSGAATPYNISKKRKWRLLIDDVPAVVRNACQTEGVYETTWDQVKNYVQNKTDGTTAP